MRGAKVPRIFLLGTPHRGGEQTGFSANTAYFTAFYRVFVTALGNEI